MKENSKEGHQGYICIECGHDAKQAKQLPNGAYVCSNPKCECQRAVWVDNR